MRKFFDALRRFSASDRSLSVLLALLITHLFVITPLSPDMHDAAEVVVAVMYTLVLFSAAMAIGMRGWGHVWLLALVVTEFGVHWLHVASHTQVTLLLQTSSGFVFSVSLACAILMLVMRDGPITRARIEGAIAFYILLGPAWAFAYKLVYLVWPTAFLVNTGAPPTGAGLQPFLYFSYVTLTTVGYGDVTPVHPLARSLANLESLTGTLFPAILLAQLVSLQLEHRKDQAARRKSAKE